MFTSQENPVDWSKGRDIVKGVSIACVLALAGATVDAVHAEGNVLLDYRDRAFRQMEPRYGKDV